MLKPDSKTFEKSIPVPQVINIDMIISKCYTYCYMFKNKGITVKTILISSTLAITLLLTTGCAPRGYETRTVGQQMTVQSGVVQSVKEVVINNQGAGNALGAIVGAVAGGALGNQIGGGVGKDVATVAGTVLGGVAGGSVGDQLDTQYGQEVIVQLNNGQTVATVLRINETTPMLAPGQAVNVFFSGSSISNISPR